MTVNGGLQADATAGNPDRPHAKRESFWQRLRTAVQTALFGYDFFISYRHSDGSVCARSLHAKLQKKFDCFLDELHYEAGHNLPRMQSLALKRARKLLVIVSPRAHDTPVRGPDWVLAEVLEFKHFARSRGAAPAIVPIGTLRTLSAENFPGSKLLPEIPRPDTQEICVIDAAVEHNAEVSPDTIQKLANDFQQVRRRQVRYVASWAAVVAVAGAAAFGFSAAQESLVAQRMASTEQAFRLVARAPSEDALNSYSESLRILESLGLDPIMPVHGLFAAPPRELLTGVLADLDGEVGTLTVSADGQWILVVYDYQAPNGAPDLEAILDQPAFGVFHIPSRTWTLKQTLGTPVGMEVYDANLEEFLPPNHVTVDGGTVGDTRKVEKLSLLDGTSEEIENLPGPATSPLTDSDQTQPDSVKSRLADLLSTEKLFEIPPEDGIDVEYGPRLVDMVEVTSPDGRTAIVGTYEGKLILVDLVHGLSLGETQTSSIFAAAFAPDSSRVYVADKGALLEVDTSGRSGITEFMALLANQQFKQEEVLAAAFSDDATIIALATTDRLLARSISAPDWSTWKLPKVTERAAALRVDQRRSRVDFVSADDGAVVSVDYRSPTSIPDVTPRPGGPGPTVAWIEASVASVWMAGTEWANGKLQVHSVPLPGGNEKTLSVEVSQPKPEGEFTSEQDGTQIHALAKLGDRLLLFHGDREFFTDRSLHLLPEQLLTAPVRGGPSADNRVIFESKPFNNGPDPVATVVRVDSVLPDAAAENILARIEHGGVVSIPTGQEPVTRKIDQLLRLYRDGDHVYEISISGMNTERWLTIRHQATGTIVRYQIPWGFPSEPKFASVAPSGRAVMLASERGEVMLLNVGRPAVLP